MENKPYQNFLGKVEAKGWTLRTIDHIDGFNRKVIIYRGAGTQPVIALITLMRDGEGYGLYLSTHDNSIDADIAAIEAS